MPVFNFGYDWMSVSFAPMNSSSSATANSSESSTSAHPRYPVFSGYFWIYLSISIGLTFITVFGWYWYTNLRPEGGYDWYTNLRPEGGYDEEKISPTSEKH